MHGTVNIKESYTVLYDVKKITLHMKITPVHLAVM